MLEPRKARVFKYRPNYYGLVAKPWQAWVPTGRGITAGRFQSQHYTWQEAMDWVHEQLAKAS